MCTFAHNIKFSINNYYPEGDIGKPTPLHMKKFLFMAIAMLTMAFAFTSCSKDDDTNNSGSNNSGKEARTIYFFDTSCQYLNRQFKVTIGSETKILKVDADLKKVSVAPESVNSSAENDSKMAQGATISIYSYEIPTTMHGDVTVYPDYSVKDGVELPEKITFLFGAYTIFGDASKVAAHGQSFGMTGLKKEAVQSYLEQRNAKVLTSGNLK